MLNTSDLRWILTAVDEAISAGVSSERGIVIQKHMAWSGEEREVAILVEPGSRTRPQRTITTNEPLSPLQRVELFISALQRAVTELPTIQEETLKELAGPPDSEPAEVGSIHFMPEVDAISPAGPPDMQRLQSPETRWNRTETRRVLDALATEVRS